MRVALEARVALREVVAQRPVLAAGLEDEPLPLAGDVDEQRQPQRQDRRLDDGEEADHEDDAEPCEHGDEHALAVAERRPQRRLEDAPPVEGEADQDQVQRRQEVVDPTNPHQPDRQRIRRQVEFVPGPGRHEDGTVQVAGGEAVRQRIPDGLDRLIAAEK